MTKKLFFLILILFSGFVLHAKDKPVDNYVSEINLQSVKDNLINITNSTDTTIDRNAQLEACLALVKILNLEFKENLYHKKNENEVLDSIKNFLGIANDFINNTKADSHKIELDIQTIKYYTNCQNYQKAKFMLDSLMQIYESNDDNFKSKNIGLLELYYSFNKYSEKQNSISVNKSDSKRSLINLLIIIAIITAAGIYIGIMLRKTKFKNAVLTLQKEEIQSQNEEIKQQREYAKEQNLQISKKNKNINDSIKYASYIQRASLPTDEIMKQTFNDYFVIYKPLDIVSGDFYWANSGGGFSMLAVADCTGHGVPGAFVSMLGVSILNELATLVRETLSASLILETLRSKVKDALHQNKEDSRTHDGMDIAFIFIYGDELHFAGANRPLIMIRNNEVQKFAPDIMPIGSYLRERKFNEKIIKIQKGDKFYMFSDGITDQFYKDTNGIRKIGVNNLCAFLQKISDKPMPDQKIAIENFVEEWKNGQAQIDDNLLVGFSI